ARERKCKHHRQIVVSRCERAGLSEQGNRLGNLAISSEIKIREQLCCSRELWGKLKRLLQLRSSAAPLGVCQTLVVALGGGCIVIMRKVVFGIEFSSAPEVSHRIRNLVLSQQQSAHGCLSAGKIRIKSKS